MKLKEMAAIYRSDGRIVAVRLWRFVWDRYANAFFFALEWDKGTSRIKRIR